MKAFQYRKGVVMGYLPGIILGAVVALLVIIGATMQAQGFGGDAVKNQDQNELENIASIAEQKCTQAEDSTVPEVDLEQTFSAEIEAVQTIQIAGEPPEQSLIAEFPEDSDRWSLNYCQYSISGESDMTQSTTWEFTVSPTRGDPPSVTIQGEPQ